MSHQANITRIKAVHTALEELADSVVYVGGATVSLYRDRPAAELRPTDDVDILLEIAKYGDYATIEEKLRSKGFVNDIESGVICRYIIHGVTVDVMPTDKSVLGFSNAWYPEGFVSAIETDLGNGIKVKIFSSAYFLGSKLEAFHHRGKKDGRMSSDFEDIVYVLNNRNVIWDELNGAPVKIKNWLQREFRLLLESGMLYEWVGAHLDYNEQRRVNIIVGGLEQFIL